MLDSIVDHPERQPGRTRDDVLAALGSKKKYIHMFIEKVEGSAPGGFRPKIQYAVTSSKKSMDFRQTVENANLEPVLWTVDSELTSEVNSLENTQEETVHGGQEGIESSQVEEQELLEKPPPRPKIPPSVSAPSRANMLLDGLGVGVDESERSRSRNS